MSASSIIRARKGAYPSRMRRLIFVVAALGALGVALYRRRSLDRWEQELAIGRHADDPAR
jgi:hypothetical protein